MAKLAARPQHSEYRTDGTHLYYVLLVGKTMSRVEDCGTDRVEMLPTIQLRQMMEVERRGEE